MCGIAGYVNLTQPGLIERMCAVMAHRGPDDEGIYQHRNVTLGHRRLAIIDLSRSGHQPMPNEDNTLWITYNGEIYNYLELREQLQRKGHIFRSKSDTEVIIHAYEEWGVECLQRFNGMFAFAIYDQKTRELFIARDRIGIKPLYYWQNGTKLIFASEMKAILEADVVQRNPNLHAISEYLALRYVPGPESLIEGIYKLPAGHYAIFKNGGQFDLTCYWKPEIYTGPYRDDEFYFETFADLLEKAVQRRLMSDVPFGAYLSGGLDSSVIVALMSQMLDQPVKTFSVGFDSPKDELSDALFTAQYLTCEHNEIICQPSDIGRLPEIVWHLDEPIGDAIVVPMYLLSMKARKQVTMVLTGEGADETLAGYLFHKVLVFTDVYHRWTPKLLQKLFLKVLEIMPANLLNSVFSYPGDIGEKGKTKVFNYLNDWNSCSLERRYRMLISLIDNAEQRELMFPSPYEADKLISEGSGPFLERVLNLQYGNWLPDDILMKQDKMSMANSLEGRVPFLDHELVEFLLSMPSHLKLKGLTEKYILREFSRSILPKRVTDREKKPFYIPLERYTQTQNFKRLLNETLTQDKVRQRGLFRWAHVEHLIERLNDYDFLYAKQVMALMILELWFQIFIDRNYVKLA